MTNTNEVELINMLLSLLLGAILTTCQHMSTTKRTVISILFANLFIRELVVIG